MRLNSTVCWYASHIRNDESTSVFVSDVVVCCLNVVILILSLPFNGYVVYIYLKTKSRQPVSNTLLCVLASFDLLQSIISQPMFIINQILKLQKIFVCPLDDASKTVFVIFSGFALFMAAVVLTTERLLAVVFPLWHRVHLRKSHVVRISLIYFVFWGCYVVVMLHVLQNPIFFRPITACLIGMNLVYAVGGYIKIYFVCQGCKKRQKATRKSTSFTSTSFVCAEFMANSGTYFKRADLNVQLSETEINDNKKTTGISKT